MATSEELFDFAVIGAGAAGIAAARRAARYGAKTVLIERDAVGGTCLNSGCVPTKYLLRHGVGDGGALGRLKDVLRNGLASELRGLGVRILSGSARFEEPGRLTVAAEDGDIRISSGNVLIASGCRDMRPAFLPESPAIVDTRGFLSLDELPPSVAVAGGGAAGCEIAAICAAAGDTEVVLLEASGEILPQFDSDAAALVRRGLEQKAGITVKTGAKIEQVEVADEGTLLIRHGDEEEEVDLFVCAIGRRPDWRGMAIERAGVRRDDRGFILADENGFTGCGGVYAAGDVVAGSVAGFGDAEQSGARVADFLFSGVGATAGFALPHVVFTDPPLATVGRSVADAPDLVQTVLPLRMNVKCAIDGVVDGFVKLVHSREGGRIEGALVVGAGAEELISPMAMAIRCGLGIRDMADGWMFPHPVRGEIWRLAAQLALGAECR